MKAYQVKIGKRGEQTATLFIVEAEDYKYAIVRASEKFAQINSVDVGECSVCDIQMIEEINHISEKGDEQIALELVKVALGGKTVLEETPVELYIAFLNKIKGKELTIEEDKAIHPQPTFEVKVPGSENAV